LRDLQRPASLAAILEAVRAERDRITFETGGMHPILVKIAPDLGEGELEGIAGVAVELADGMIATNTTLDHAGIAARGDQAGGLSGAPLFARATEVLRQARRLVGPRYPLVGVGGVMDGATAKAKVDAGADLVQAYTGFIYGGPLFAKRVVEGMKR
jgi:dihydroorotate dehydrogenase